METYFRHKAAFLGSVILFAVAAVLSSGVCAALADYEDVDAQVIEITAKQFEFSPNVIRLKKGAPVRLEIRTADVLHGFNCPEMGFRADVTPGMVAKVSFTPNRAGEFEFYCDIFCGEKHAKMTGKFIVEEEEQPVPY